MGAPEMMSATQPLFGRQCTFWAGGILKASDKSVSHRTNDLAGIVVGVQSMCTNASEASDLQRPIYVQHEDTTLRHFMRRAPANEVLEGRVSQDCRL